MQNPKAFAIRKWLSDLLQERYAPQDQIVERVSYALVTQKDLEDFGKLLGEVYSAGFMKAYKDYEKELKKHGVTVKLTTEKAKKD